jgi:2-oxoglutarate dehydrogenase E2 component (dihydrolipoamide succinyltransferase)
MSVEITVPQLGESIVEATVGQWFKRAGDQVSEGDAVVELETDKVNMEVAAPASGTLSEILKEAGETVNVGEALGVVQEGDGVAAAVESPSAISEVETETVEANGSSGADGDDGPRATPLARRVASEHGIDLNTIAGTGPGGRVRREDVLAHLETGGQQLSRGVPAAAPSPAPATQTAPATPIQTPARGPSGPSAPPVPTPAPTASGRSEERVRMSRRRQTIARRLVEAQQTAAMLTTFNEVDMAAIMDVRKRRKEVFQQRYGVGLGYMSFFTRAVIGALKVFPRLNAEIQGDEIVLKHYYDIGIAVGADEGLVVPVLRDADRLSFAEIERQIADLAGRARAGQLTLPELQGGTFTITNGGVFGSLLSTPILNTPQVGILGMHKIQERPVAIDGQVVIRPMMYLALSYDHRIVDGNEAVRFLVRVKELLEDPEALLLEG